TVSLNANGQLFLVPVNEEITEECLYFPGEDCSLDWGNKIVDSHRSSSSSKGFAITGEPSYYGRASNYNVSEDRLIGIHTNEEGAWGNNNVEMSSKSARYNDDDLGEAQLGRFESPINKQMDVEGATIILGCGPNFNRSDEKATKIFIGPSTSSGQAEDTGRNAEVVVAGGGLDNPNRIADSPERTPEVQREQDAIEDPFIVEDNPNRRESSPVRTMVGPNRNAEEDVDGGGLDIPNRIVDSPEWMTEVQPEQMPLEICQMHAAKGCRRQVRQKNLEDILIRSSCPSHKGHRINSMPRHAGIRMPQAAESSRQRSIHTETESGMEVRDSQFINMNRLNYPKDFFVGKEVLWGLF
ncbi:hypothetical protein Ancab_014264, partial [Ancistrocladus abbreviatus]